MDQIAPDPQLSRASSPPSHAPVEGTPRVGHSLSQVDPRRSLILMAVGAVVGLGIAGFALFTAKGTAVHTVPAEDVAVVNQRPVLMSDFVAQVEGDSGAPFNEVSAADKQKVLDAMTREELFVQRGLELDFPSSDPDTRSALVAAVEQQVAADVTAEQPTDAKLRAYYEAHREQYSSDGLMTLQDLVFTDGATPERQAAAIAALRSGGPRAAAEFAALGLKSTGKVDDGEEFYFAAKIHLGDALFAVARTLKAGDVSGPHPQADGVHVLVMQSNKAPVPLTFEDARRNVLFDYKKEASDKLSQATERYLRRKAQILMADAYKGAGK